MKSASPLVIIASIVALSGMVSIVLFGLLRSTGIFKYGPLEFGGAAAGFFASFWLLSRWYDRLNKSLLERLDLSRVVARIIASAMVREAERNVDDLNTRYIDTLSFLRSHIKTQNPVTRKAVEKEFYDEAIRLSKLIVEFKDWKPPSIKIDQVVEDIA